MRDDGQPSPSELVYGTPLTLPGDLITPSEVHEYPRCADYSYQLREHMENIRPIVTKHHTKRGEDGSYVDPRLQTCSRVLLKRMNKHSLQKNYTGPHEIVARHDKYFTIRLPNGTSDNVTVDRLKACYTLEEALPPPAQPAYHEITIYPHDQIGPDDLPPLLQEDLPEVPIAEPPPVARERSPALIFRRQNSPATTPSNVTNDSSTPTVLTSSAATSPIARTNSSTTPSPTSYSSNRSTPSPPTSAEATPSPEVVRQRGYSRYGRPLRPPIRYPN